MTEYVSLGGSCATAFNIRKFASTHTSYPFDWAKISINQLNAVLSNDFKDYENLVVKKFSINHPLIITDNNDNDIISSEGSLILTNSYGISFAHTILERDKLENFIDNIKKKRIKAFRDLNKRSEVIFVRLETGKLNSKYNDRLMLLLDNLQLFFSKSFKLLLIVHEINKDLININNLINNNNNNIDLHFFSEFSSDWKYPFINWESILANNC